MNVQNYYKLTDSLNGVETILKAKKNEMSDEIKEDFGKPYLISYETANRTLKALLLLIVFSSLFLLGLNAQTTRTVGGGGGTDYSTLKDAFDDINAGNITGDIILNMMSSTTETSTAMLEATGITLANYTSVTIQPNAGSTIVISGNISGSLIHLNGASNVLFDGINSGGDSLFLVNSNTSGNTLLFSNSAEDNTITRLTILGACTAANTGIVSFTTASGSFPYGNRNNEISYCVISATTTTNNPANAVYSAGTSGKPNSDNSILNCAISDFKSSSVTHSGIRLQTNNNTWVISNNKLFRRTAVNITSASVVTYGIMINDGGGYTVSDNVIGYASSSKNGKFNYTVAASGHTFYGLYMRSTNSDPSTVATNEIAGIEIDASANAFVFQGMFFEGSASPIELGVEYNAIGSLVEANSLVLKTTGRLDLYPFNFNGSTNNFLVGMYFNTVGSINSGTVNPGSFYSSIIFVGGNANSEFDISGNTIGATGPGVISLGTPSATGDYKIYGVNLNTSGGIDLNDNTVSYLYENSRGTSAPWIYGVYVNFAGGTAFTGKIIRDNRIHDIISFSGYSSFGARVSTGIYIESGNNSYTLMVQGNTIYNIKYVGAEAKSNNIAGIGIPGTNQEIKIFNNVIYGIENNSTYAWATNTYDRGGISGIEMNNSTNTTNLVEIYNNRIYLRADNGGSSICVPIKGIEVHSLSAVYFNTVVISGNACGSGGTDIPTTCLSGGQYLEIPVLNNIFYNNRTGNGKHYAIANDGYTTYTTSDYTFFTNFNIYYTANASTMAKWGSTDQTLAQWLSSVRNSGSGPAVDSNSLNVDPQLASLNDMTKWYAGSITAPLRFAGTPISGISLDCFANSRDINNPYVGAIERIISIWVGTVGDHFDSTENWYSRIIPEEGEDIYFADTPTNHCVLYSNKSIGKLENHQSVYHLVTNGYTLKISGDINASSTGGIDASAAGSVIEFNGNTVQTVSPTGFLNNEIYNLTTNNGAGVIFNSDILVSDTLRMTNGNLNMPVNNITLGTSTTSLGYLDYNSGIIDGSMTRWFADAVNTGNSGLFPLGVNEKDRFVTVEYTSAPSTGGTLTAVVNTGDMGSSGLPLTGIVSAGSCPSFDVVNTSDNGYWEIDTGAGLDGGTYTITLVGEGINGVSSLCELTAIKRVNMGPWMESGTHQDVTGSVGRPVLVRTGAVGWSNWGFGGGGLNPLPLKISAMKALCQKNNTVLTWRSESGADVQFFEIERSLNGKIWETAGKMEAKENNGTYNQYQYTDYNTNGESWFYRLRVINQDQNSELSATVLGRCQTEVGDVLNIYPNPASEVLHLNSDLALGHIEVYDVMGKLVYEADSDTETHDLNLNGFDHGVYLIKTLQGQIRFVKQ